MSNALATGKRTYLHADKALDFAIRAAEALGLVFWALAPGADIWATDYSQNVFRIHVGKSANGERLVTGNGRRAYVSVGDRRTVAQADEWTLFSTENENVTGDVVAAAPVVEDAPVVAETVAATSDVADAAPATTYGYAGIYVDMLDAASEAAALGRTRRQLDALRTIVTTPVSPTESRDTAVKRTYAVHDVMAEVDASSEVYSIARAIAADSNYLYDLADARRGAQYVATIANASSPAPVVSESVNVGGVGTHTASYVGNGRDGYVAQCTCGWTIADKFTGAAGARIAAADHIGDVAAAAQDVADAAPSRMMGITATGVVIFDREQGKEFGFHSACWEAFSAQVGPTSRLVSNGPIFGDDWACTACIENEPLPSSVEAIEAELAAAKTPEYAELTARALRGAQSEAADAAPVAHTVTVEKVSMSSGPGWRAVCTCDYASAPYFAAHAAQTMADAHAKENAPTTRDAIEARAVAQGWTLEDSIVGESQRTLTRVGASIDLEYTASGAVSAASAYGQAFGSFGYSDRIAELTSADKGKRATVLRWLDAPVGGWRAESRDLFRDHVTGAAVAPVVSASTAYGRMHAAFDALRDASPSDPNYADIEAATKRASDAYAAAYAREAVTPSLGAVPEYAYTADTRALRLAIDNYVIAAQDGLTWRIQAATDALTAIGDEYVVTSPEYAAIAALDTRAAALEDRYSARMAGYGWAEYVADMQDLRARAVSIGHAYLIATIDTWAADLDSESPELAPVLAAPAPTANLTKETEAEARRRWARRDKHAGIGYATCYRCGANAGQMIGLPITSLTTVCTAHLAEAEAVAARWTEALEYLDASKHPVLSTGTIARTVFTRTATDYVAAPLPVIAAVITSEDYAALDFAGQDRFIVQMIESFIAARYGAISARLA